MKRLLTILIMAVSLAIGSAAIAYEPTPFYSVTNPTNAVEYIIPVEFPDPFKSSLAENFYGEQIPMEGGFIFVKYSKIDESNEFVGPVYGLIFSSSSGTLVAAILLNKSDQTWKYWIYLKDMPIPCTEKEQQDFFKGLVNGLHS